MLDGILPDVRRDVGFHGLSVPAIILHSGCISRGILFYFTANVRLPMAIDSGSTDVLDSGHCTCLQVEVIIMAVRKILKYPHDEARLRKKSAEVKRLDSDIKKLIGDLKDTLATQPGAGLAAPQMGIYKRVALVR